MIQRTKFLQCVSLGVAVLALGGPESASCPQDTRPASAPSAPADPIKNFSYSTPRMSVRGLVYELREGSGPTIHGQFMVHFNQPEWHKEYDHEFDARTRGFRWRFCIDFWTVLDTNVPLSIGGKRFSPGDHYLLIARSKDGQWSLVVLDAALVRAKKLDATQAPETTEGTLVPLKYEKLDRVEPKLRIDLVPDPKQSRRFELEIRYGPHKASVEILAEI